MTRAPREDEPRPPAERLLVRLERAVLTWRIYPRSSPFVDGAVGAVLQEARLLDSEITYDISPKTIRWEAGETVGSTSEVSGLARDLHYQQIARLRLAPELDERSGSALVGAIADGINAETSPLLEREIEGVAATPLNVDGLFEDGVALEESDDPWDHLLVRFASLRPGVPRSWRILGRDAEATREFLAWALDPGNTEGELRRHATADRFTLLTERLAERAGPDHRHHVVTACAGLAGQLDPEAWIDVLSDPMVIEGHGGEAIDLADEIVRQLAQQQVLRLSRYALRTRSRATPRLYRFFRRIVTAHPSGKVLGGQLLADAEQAGKAGDAGAWPGFAALVHGEDASAFLTDDYRGLVEHGTAAIAPRTRGEVWSSSTIRQRAREIDPGFVRARKARILLSLLERERDDADYAALARALTDCLDALLERGEAALLEAVLGAAADHRNEPQRSDYQRAEAGKIIAGLATPEALERLARLVAGASEVDRDLWRVVEIVGPEVVPHLIEALELNPGPAFRTLLARLVRRLPEPPVPPLRAAVVDPRVFVARNGAWLAAHLDPELATPLVLVAATHRAPEVRREALANLGHLPGAAAEEALLKGLDDSVLDVRVAAARTLRSRLEQHPMERILAYLGRSNLTGRHTAVIVTAARALGRVGNTEALPALRRLARPPWLFRRRREAVAVAAREAIDAIHARLQSTAGDRSRQLLERAA